MELDAKIADSITEPDELETEIFKAVEIQDTISEYTHLAKRVIDRSEHQPQVPTAAPLNVNAPPYQPPSVNTTSTAKETQVTNTSTTLTHSDTENTDTLENTDSLENTQQSGVTDREATTPLVNVTPQFTTRLPKLTLPTFSGNPLMWQTFWDSFSAAVHCNEALTGVQKFNYLRAQLMDEAARTIVGLPLTNDNYQHSIKLLKERFGQTDKIVNSHMQALLALPNPSNNITSLRTFYDSIESHMQALLALPNPSNNITSLRTFYDSIESHIRGLAALGQSKDSYSALLVPIILGKLSVETRRNLARDHPTFEWSIDSLRTAILKEIRVFEAGLYSSHQSPDSSSMTASFHTSAQVQRHKTNIGGKDRMCVYYRGAHSATNCNVIVEHHKRLEYIKKEGLCFNCLAKHRVAQCTSRNHCKQCSHKHHTSVCKTYSNRQPLMGNQSSNPPIQHTRPNEIEAKQTAPPVSTPPASNATTPVTTTLASNPQSSVLFNQGDSICLLKTAVTEVVSDKVRAVANILFDEGAQRSFISQQLANTLNLTPLRQESITLAPFGSDTMTPQNLSVALINIVAKTGELIPLSVLVVPRIAAPLQTVSHAKLTSLPYLHGLTLAHPMLIGVDHYWKLVGDHTIRGDGPTAVQSKLGYLLSGPLHLSNHRTEIVSTFHVSVSPSIEQTIEKFWSIESAGTLPAQPQSCNQFTDNYLKSIVQDESGSYVTKFPWKNDHAPLPTNFKVCARRTRALARRLTNTPDLLQMYNNIIKEQERRGFIEKIDSSPSNSPVHYIPHRHVSITFHTVT